MKTEKIARLINQRIKLLELDTSEKILEDIKKEYKLTDEESIKLLKIADNVLMKKKWEETRQEMNEKYDNIEFISPLIQDKKIDVPDLTFEECFERLIGILKRYMIVDEKYYKVIALWIIGTYFHKNFRTYPYLFLNASKGSGKTRLLKMIAFLSKNGKVIGLPSEAFMFRAAETTTFCLDEMENVSRPDKQDLRLLLNSSYKRGLFIPRMKKDENGDIVVEQFEAYAPMCIANIWGLDDVLQDRCITIIIETAHNDDRTKKIEAWDVEEDVLQIKAWLDDVINKEVTFFSVVKCSDVMCFQQIEKMWNDILDNMSENNTHTLNNTTTYNTITTLNYTTNKSTFDQAFGQLDWASGKYIIEPSEQMLSFFKKIYDSNIEGRSLEHYMPLFFMAKITSDSLFDELIDISKEETAQKSIDDQMENRDVMLLVALNSFIKEKDEKEFYSIRALKDEMVVTCGEEKMVRGELKYEAPDWLNQKWLGRAVKRMGLIVNKKRLANGIMVMFNFQKIKEKYEHLNIEGEKK